VGVITELPTPASDGASGRPPRPVVTGADGALAGVVAAGVALAAGELACGIGGSGPSLVTAVGTQFIDRFAASLKDLAVALFGTNDKVALIVGIVVVSLLLGAAFGRAGTRRPWVAVAGFGGFGLVGMLAFLDDPQGGTVTGVVAAAVAVAAGLATLFGLLHLLRLGHAATAATAGPLASRRYFLVSAGSLAAMAVGAAVLGRRFARSDVVEAVRETTDLPRPAGPTSIPVRPVADVPGLSPYLTPNEEFFRIDTALVVPQVDATRWRLRVDGMVDRPLEIGYDELVAMADVAETVTLQCVSNEVGGSLVGTATWQGVPLARLLERAGVRPGGTQIVGRAVDGFTAGFPTAVALDGRTALVAVAMNGEPLPATHGFPARLVVAGLYGYVSATKWLDAIQVAPWEDVNGYWITRGWSKEGPIKLMSRIDVPRSGATLAAGPQPIAGVAWQPTVGIDRVEVQVDDGPWTPARLGDAVSDDTWVQWYLPWDATTGEHRIRVRAVSKAGEVQTEERADPAPDGATGWHTRSVRVG
jgi:DMSO/TMAO reductase YedYZ molybdopterin-dependent catalytic subunit